MKINVIYSRVLSLILSLVFVFSCGVICLADAVVIEDGVTEIRERGFAENFTMTELHLPDTLKIIGSEAFFLCVNLKEVTIPGSVEMIGRAAFDNCESLAKITIEEGVKEICNGAFSDTAITDITIPGSVGTVSEGLFRGCEKLEDVTLEYGVKVIDTEAFAGCSRLTTLRLPASVTKLGSRVFFYCWDLEALYIPPTVTEMGSLGHDVPFLEKPEFTIYGVKGSYAETFALENEYNFVEYDFCPEGHTYSSEYIIEKEPDCENIGRECRECVNCGERTDYRDIPALEHEFSEEYTIDLEPTVIYAGSKSRHCTRCEATTDVTELPIIEFEENFADVEEGDWYYDAVLYVSHKGLFNGVNETDFAPDMNMSRAMLVTVLFRLKGEPEVGLPLPGYMKKKFNDVKEDDYFYKAVDWAANNGIVNGVGGNLFDPHANVSREQMATILYRFTSTYMGDTSPRGDLSQFADGSVVSSYATKPMSWAVGSGLINGLNKSGNICLDPASGATRAQVSTILMRYLLPALAEK